MSDVFAFDWGTTVVGVLDIHANAYTPYRGKAMFDAAQMLSQCRGTIVSFNGLGKDLAELALILGIPQWNFEVDHADMQVITSRERWPPDPGTSPILGEGLVATHKHYFGEETLRPTENLTDPYLQANWRDCRMTADLWVAWKEDALASHSKRPNRSLERTREG